MMFLLGGQIFTWKLVIVDFCSMIDNDKLTIE